MQLAFSPLHLKGLPDASTGLPDSAHRISLQRAGHSAPDHLFSLRLSPKVSLLVTGALSAKTLSLFRRRRSQPRRHTYLSAVDEAVEIPLDQLKEVIGEYLTTLPQQRLEALRQKFPTLQLDSNKIRLVSEDPPVVVLEDVLNEEECSAMVESMRNKDGSFPERLGQSDLPALPSWLGPAKTLLRGIPVLDWLGNPTVRWTFRSRMLLNDVLNKVQTTFGLNLEQGAANIKHYRKDQWLPVHIDYNHATMLIYLSDVKEGGYTLFPTLGIKVKPRKGSALLWPNQPPLKHAGDRIIEGEKWILFYNYPAEQNWEYDDNFEFNE